MTRRYVTRIPGRLTGNRGYRTPDRGRDDSAREHPVLRDDERVSPLLTTEPKDEPRTLRDQRARERRRTMLDLPHMAPLKEYAAHLRHQSGGLEAPDFDPLDGGIQARALFLFEKPGPMTSESGKRAGSGFVSRNNNGDPHLELNPVVERHPQDHAPGATDRACGYR